MSLTAHARALIRSACLDNRSAGFADSRSPGTGTAAESTPAEGDGAPRLPRQGAQVSVCEAWCPVVS